MKQFYLFILLLSASFVFSQNFTDTKGELQISASGTASYTLPIAIPPSIKGVAPIINLNYSSGVRGGIAGQGWSINSISAISRIATRRDIDGFVDGVDFDADDKLALDGQRLLLKTGTYWAPGSTYETEYKSNTKIELKVEGTTTYFIVTAPDGSRSWYGSKGSGSLQNSVSLNSWYIVHYEDPNGNFIDYNYKTITYNGSSQLYIDTITFSGNAAAGIAAQNKIAFFYKSARRIERDYLKGAAVYATELLQNIQVTANGTYFRTYTLSHTIDPDLGYERLTSIQEFNGANEPSNPVVFTYASSPNNQQRTEKTYTNTLSFDRTQLAGDFDGDGRLDFVANNQIFTNLFEGSTGNTPTEISSGSLQYRSFIAKTLTNNKINQFHSIITPTSGLNKIDFKYYQLDNGVVSNYFTKTIQFNNQRIPGIFTCQSNDSGYSQYLNDYNNSNTGYDGISDLIEGDFNGDGISEVIFNIQSGSIDYIENCYATEFEGVVCDCQPVVNPVASKNYWLNLDSNADTQLNGSGFVNLNANLLSSIWKFVGDFDGDGKSDILTLNENKSYKILSLKQLAVSPWVTLEVIGEGTLDQYSTTKQMLFGDFNGDGKTDIMLPTSEGGSGQAQWNTYYSNPNPAGGSSFVKEISTIVEYWPDTGSSYNTQRHWSSYYAMDINKDGKSDLVRVRRKYYKASWTINNRDTEWQITAYANNVGVTTGSGFNLAYDSGILDSKSPDIPIPITSNYKYQGANTDLILVRGNNKIVEYYQFNKNVDTENRLISVTESNGNITQTIHYLPMEAAGGGLGIAATDFYSSSNAVTYPNIEIIRNPNSFLVSKLTATINGVSKFQDFRYRGYVSNYNYGTVGFTRSTRSSWYLSAADTKIYTTIYNDVALRGANTITWTSTNPATVFDAVPSGLVTTKTNVFSTYTNPTSKVYNVLLDTQTTLDALSGVKSESTYTYDGTVTSATYFGLETKSINRQYSGATFQGSVTIDSQYDSNAAGAGSAYYIGRPKKVNTSSNNVASGDTRTAEEIYTYTGSNLTKTEKKGYNTYAIVEDMTFDILGNLLTKTVSAPGAPAPVPTARTITDQYDATKRFVIKKTDHQGFITSYTYNPMGQVLQSTDYMGVINDFSYDNWGKLITTTVTKTSAVPITTSIAYKKLASGGYTTTTTNNLDAKTITQYDVLGRVVISSTKGFAANTLVSKQIVYDGLGRRQKESEPYFSAPSLWTTYEYDYLMRTTKVTAPTGKIQTMTYLGLTVTSNDDGKITTATADALGNKVQSTDPGGTINFKYFANGQLKESDYQGNKVQINIDGWGNKIWLSDPSAGIYTYSYDAFGQLKTETTPNGTTAFVYDAAGKPTEKTITGTNTNSKTTYAYNTLNQITSSTFLDSREAKTTTNVYEYDTLKRLFKTAETTPYATFVKQLSFDTLGRIEKETSTATASGKTSSKTVKNTYQNGFPWQILDDTTQQVLWQSNTLNERGQLLTGAFGNGIAVTNTYDLYGYTTQIKHDKTSPTVVNIMTLNTAFEIKRGNLNSRTNSLFSRNESFKYDTLDRLTEYTNGMGIQETQVYDDKGRITQNAVGTYEYDGTKTYQNKAITPTPVALGYYGMREGIFNDSMEDGTGFGVVRDAVSTVYVYDTTKAHTGKTSLKIPNLTTIEKYVHGDKWIAIDNAVDTQYTYSAWVYSDNPQAQMFLFMKTPTETGYFSVTDDIITNVKNQWVKIEKTVVVPAHIKKLNIRLDNNGSGNVWFDDVQIRKTSDAATAVRALNVSYNTFKGPVDIEETGVDRLSFTYNDGNDRSSMFYGGLQTDKLLRTYRKHYSADGSMEIKQNTVTGALEFVTYIGGDGYTAPVVLKSDGTAQNYLYLHRDYQGTIVAISDQSGAVVEKRLFDAWGNIVKVQDGAGNILAGLTLLDRGYTGHEHLQSIGIIHMNGRLYDPRLHRFLQPDNYVQEPYNTQNYNKYGYVLNNPLKYTDQSGEAYELLVAVGIGVAIAITSYTLTALLADVPFSVGGLVKTAFVGAASSLVTFGIGSAATNLFTNFFSKAAFQAAAHGTFQGTMTAISGGKFWSGFAAGALSSAAAGIWSGGQSMDGLGKNANAIAGTGMKGIGGGMGDLGMIAFGTVSGGAGAALTGGNIWQGAATGLVVSGLNHAMHSIKTNKYINNRLRYLGKDPDAPAEIGQSELQGFAKDLFPNMMEQADDPSFLLKEKIISPDGSAAYGETYATSENGVTTAKYINISRSALSNWNLLASTIGHELNHYIFFNTGVYDRWVRKFGEIRADALSENKGQYWEYRMGGTPSYGILNSTHKTFNTGR
ncbi:RHS repeat-associated core domain-containing protein [Flavobacterium sp. CLA17]|uniref:RHS repeat-associated core domain-containing protein n=1 Tax=Flavobacterium sp. CLA17 TaxID=2724135 RepID=UPI001492AF33|nr:RHS repeat-associated core domain-containing protein [Flavobacterium sp. CLA17]QSB25550.1 VCBS repeat-containing protein [Flavobacterium sp. CLA17]